MIYIDIDKLLGKCECRKLKSVIRSSWDNKPYNIKVVKNSKDLITPCSLNLVIEYTCCISVEKKLTYEYQCIMIDKVDSKKCMYYKGQ